MKRNPIEKVMVAGLLAMTFFLPRTGAADGVKVRKVHEDPPAETLSAPMTSTSAPAAPTEQAVEAPAAPVEEAAAEAPATPAEEAAKAPAAPVEEAAVEAPAAPAEKAAVEAPAAPAEKAAEAPAAPAEEAAEAPTAPAEGAAEAPTAPAEGATQPPPPAPEPPGLLQSAYERVEKQLSEAESNAVKTLQEQWQDHVDPLASPDAVPGGKITYAASSPPKSLNPYLDNNVFSYQVFGSLYETLLGSDPLTADYAPGLARRWEISNDKKQFTFYIDPIARWSDGQPVTAEDVLWTFNAIMAPASQTGPAKVALRTFTATPPEVLDRLTIRFTASDVHWRNLGAAGGFEILPKHVFEGKDFNKINNEFPVVSGPYRIAEHREGISLTLRRRPDWWARARSATRGTYNFDTVVYRFFAEQDNAFEAFLAGEVDVFPVYRAAIWTGKTTGVKFDSNWIVKRQIRNHHPIGFQGFAMNLRRKPFNDIRVRKALALLLDRKRMNETLMANQYFLHRSYYEGLYDLSNVCSNVTFDFNPDEARRLLDEAGWKTDPATGMRKKNGKPLSFTFLTRDESSDKFLALYEEDLRKAGVEMKIERKDWAAWTRDMEEYRFDMTWAAWSSGLYPDPESMWSSIEAGKPGGNNITGFSNAIVDELIKMQESIFNVRERNAICRRIDTILAEQVPYILLWNVDSVRLLYWDKFGTPPTVLSKFGDERSLLVYWWYDADNADDLREVMQSGEALPPRPDIVDFDESFLPAEQPSARLP